jgi:hypothetical protein
MLQNSQVSVWRECVSVIPGHRIIRRIGEVRIERNVIARNIEAGMVEEIERQEIVLQMETLVILRYLPGLQSIGAKFIVPPLRQQEFVQTFRIAGPGLELPHKARLPTH